MRRFLTLTRALGMALTFTALMIGLVPLPAVKAQSGTSSIPVTLYRWRVSNSNYGYMLHQSLSAGQNLGYANEGSVYQTFFASSLRGGIVPPQPPGYTPAPGNPLIPIYQWRVVQGGRTYYYYSGAGFGGGPGYYYEGQLGWVLPANYQSGSALDQNGRPIHSAPINYYYSTSKGYWYTSFRPDQGGAVQICFPDACHPGNTSYSFQGVGFQLPIWDSAPGNFPPPAFTFLPPPPPPTCDPIDEQACYNNGGSWNSSTCSCNYFDPDPEPCPPGMICEATLQNQRTAKPAPEPEPPLLK